MSTYIRENWFGFLFLLTPNSHGTLLLFCRRLVRSSMKSLFWSYQLNVFSENFKLNMDLRRKVLALNNAEIRFTGDISMSYLLLFQGMYKYRIQLLLTWTSFSQQNLVKENDLSKILHEVRHWAKYTESSTDSNPMSCSTTFPGKKITEERNIPQLQVWCTHKPVFFCFFSSRCFLSNFLLYYMCDLAIDWTTGPF